MSRGVNGSIIGKLENKTIFSFFSFSYYGSDKNLFLVAMHEIGHALGLRHSDNSASIMQPRYPSASRSTELPSPDIDSIQHLYGAKKEKIPCKNTISFFYT